MRPHFLKTWILTISLLLAYLMDKIQLLAILINIFYFEKEVVCFYFVHWLFLFLCNYVCKLCLIFCSYLWNIHFDEIFFFFFYIIGVHHLFEICFKCFLPIMPLNFLMMSLMLVPLKISHHNIYLLSLYEFWVVYFTWEALPSQTHKDLYSLLTFL